MKMCVGAQRARTARSAGRCSSVTPSFDIDHTPAERRAHPARTCLQRQSTACSAEQSPLVKAAAREAAPTSRQRLHRLQRMHDRRTSRDSGAQSRRLPLLRPSAR
uniref:Uncharacterized protein n=1 Tax=Plectus sambesii TaxID=2011161 RepID=A0A914WSL9_9BILA